MYRMQFDAINKSNKIKYIKVRKRAENIKMKAKTINSGLFLNL